MNAASASNAGFRLWLAAIALAAIAVGISVFIDVRLHLDYRDASLREVAEYAFLEDDMYQVVERDAHGVTDSWYETVPKACACVPDELAECRKKKTSDDWGEIRAVIEPVCKSVSSTEEAEALLGQQINVRHMTGMRWEIGSRTLYAAPYGWVADGVNFQLPSWLWICLKVALFHGLLFAAIKAWRDHRKAMPAA